ncbi:protease [Catellatospora sp. TT07R-123]|uniref:trypsin-like serine protease n=1 Tax=Catellatospora sp. TT07R-123 TaxID=2733863 RepID=UPI001B1FA242|nr:trypsin-like serine protease [Catellatospora sp. TT07R-123]GHJ49745.1 protease [Catellatospora sp. TT07R-123]
MSRKRIIVSLTVMAVLAAGAAAVVLHDRGSAEPQPQAAFVEGAGYDITAAPEPSSAASPTASGAGGAPAAPSATGTGVVAPASTAYLRTRYGVSAAEAQRRLALQETAGQLGDRLAARFPDQYAGLWLDQAAGGVLTVASTVPGALTAELARTGDAAHVRVVRAEHSLRELTDAATRARTALGETDGAAVAVDPVTNRVLVTANEQVPAGDPALAAALAAADAAGTLRRVTGPVGVPKSCNPLNCHTPPMRGGIRLDVPRDDGTVGGCTTGYNLRSQVTGAYYVLTAGHCVNSDRHTRRDDTWHDYLGQKIPVGIEPADATLRGQLSENVAGIGSAYDYAVLPYQPGAERTWSAALGLINSVRPVPSLNYWCPGGCAGSHDVQLTGLLKPSAVQVGWVVCASGAGYTPKAGEQYVDSGAGAGYQPGTRCGEVTAVGTLISVRICARPGDSGGPLFTEADGKALGILKFGDPGSGPCTNAAELNHYSPVATILDRVNARTGNSLKLVLSVTGPVVGAPPKPQP